MRFLIQRVSQARVKISGETVGQIGRGFLVLAGFRIDDRAEDINRMADKCLNLRVFEDEQGKMNRSLLDICGELLVVSQFTLYANCRKGRRPGFDRSLEPESAEYFYNRLIEQLRQSGLKVAAGRFGARMEVELINDGPVTFVLEV